VCGCVFCVGAILENSQSLDLFEVIYFYLREMFVYVCLVCKSFLHLGLLNIAGFEHFYFLTSKFAVVAAFFYASVSTAAEVLRSARSLALCFLGFPSPLATPLHLNNSL
jgi:hypothetical protein